jgi:DNA repair ATPase RecN
MEQPQQKEGSDLSYGELFRQTQELKEVSAPYCIREIIDGIIRQIENSMLASRKEKTFNGNALQEKIQTTKEIMSRYISLQTRVQIPLIQYETTRFSQLDYYSLKALYRDLENLFENIKQLRQTLQIQTTTLHFDSLYEHYQELQSLKRKYEAQRTHHKSHPPLYRLAS